MAIKAIEIKNFAGGINTFVNKTQVRDNESPDMLNMDFEGLSSIKRRSGFVKYTGTEIEDGKRVRGLFKYFNGTLEEVLYLVDDTLYKGDDNTPISGFTFTSDKDTDGCQVGARLYLANGNNNLVYYDGSTLTEITSNGNIGSICIFFGRRVYMNNIANPDRVYFGGAMADDGTVTNTGNFSTTTPAFGGFYGFGKGKKVTGFAKFGTNTLYVFLENAIYRVTQTAGTGDDEVLIHAVELVTNSYGCIAPKSIDQVENDIFFLSEDGVYSLGEQPNYVNIRTKELSARVKNLLNAIPAASKKRASAIYFQHRYYLAFTIGTYNDRVLVYDTRYQGWLYWSALNASCWLDAKDTDDEPHLYFGSDNSSNSFVYEAEQGANDDGTAINWSYYTKCFDIDDFSQEKIFKWGKILFGSVYGVVGVDVILNETSYARRMSIGESLSYADGWGSLPLGTFPWGLDYNTPDGTVLETVSRDWRWFDIDGVGTNIQFKFSGSTLNEGGQVEKARCEYIPISPMKKDTSKYIS